MSHIDENDLIAYIHINTFPKISQKVTIIDKDYDHIHQE